MRAVVYQHAEHEGAGLLGPALQRAGFETVTRMRQVRHHEDAQAALLVVLGGPMGVYEADAHPFLHHERAVLAERLGAQRPCLGICLGAQLLAAAAGSEVTRGKNGLEVGVAPVRWTREGLQDPLLAGVRERTQVAHWHSDTWSPVPGSQLLASTDRYAQQAFRLGASYGLQFHLELTAEALDGWLVHGEEELKAAGKELSALRKDLGKLRAAEAENGALLERLAEHFAHAVR